MTVSVVVMMIIGFILIFSSFFISERLGKKETDFNVDLLTVDENYEFSDRELRIIKRKIEDVIATQAKDILYETNESLSSMANEKTMALGDYAVAVCDEIEKSHKEVLFLYSMLDDKQKEIMNTVRTVNQEKQEVDRLLEEVKMCQSEERMFASEWERKLSGVEQMMTVSSRNNEESARIARFGAATGIPEEGLNPGIATGKQMAGLLSIRQSEEEQTLSAKLDDLEEKDRNDDFSDVSYEAEETYIEEEGLDEEDLFEEAGQTDDAFEQEMEEEFRDNENSNGIILEMYKNGNSVLEIARQLGLGVGEVKLVIDLYRGEEE